MIQRYNKKHCLPNLLATFLKINYNFFFCSELALHTASCTLALPRPGALAEAKLKKPAPCFRS
jgi:hypothetical protein